MHPSQTRETEFNKDEEKHGQREILESRDIRQVPNKRRVEVQSQNRDLLIRDVCTCLARRGTPPGQGGIQILGSVETPVVDVPVLMQPAFLQSVLVPQVQFFDRMVDIPVCYGYSGRKLWRFRSCRSWVRGALFDSGYIFCVSSRVILDEFRVFLSEWVDSALEVASRLALRLMAAHVVDHGSGLFSSGFAGIDAPRAVFPTFALRMEKCAQ